MLTALAVQDQQLHAQIVSLEHTVSLIDAIVNVLQLIILILQLLLAKNVTQIVILAQALDNA